MSRRRLVVEADGGSRGNPGPAGFGALVRDAGTGELLAERADGIGTETNNVAEYRGLIAGLQAAYEIDPEAEVEVRMDSKLVVEQMSGRWKIKHPSMQPLAREARAVFPPERVRYAWIPREINTHADRLANAAMDAAARGRRWEPAEPVERAEPAPPTRLLGEDDVGEPTALVLVRHGESANTVARVFCGRGGADPALTERGRTQAEAAAGAVLALAERPVAVVSSPLLRTRQTAEPLAAALGVEVRVDDAVAEASFGEWDGSTFAQVRERWPVQLQAWLDSPAVAPPGGESLDEVSARVLVARDRLRARYAGRSVVVVTHVTPITQLVRLVLGAPASAAFRMELAPASLHRVRWWPDGGGSLQSFNDTAHLAGLLD